MGRKRRRYDDKFRTNAVLILEAAGYPDRKGALAHAARALGMPESTLHGWANGKNNPAPSELRCEKKADVIEFIKQEIPQIFRELGDARQDANYRELMIGFGIIMDKWLLLSGDPTERREIKGSVSVDYSSKSDDELRQEVARQCEGGAGEP